MAPEIRHTFSFESEVGDEEPTTPMSVDFPAAPLRRAARSLDELPGAERSVTFSTARPEEAKDGDGAEAPRGRMCATASSPSGSGDEGRSPSYAQRRRLLPPIQLEMVDRALRRRFGDDDEGEDDDVFGDGAVQGGRETGT